MKSFHFLGSLALAWSCVAQADGLDALSQFLKTVHSARAEFSQIVTSPSKASGTPRVKKSSGVFEFVRPSYFRFDYQKPYAQLIVADGQTLWLYDPDLQQVTARHQAQSLSNTPAALIATASDIRALEKDFDLQAQADAQGLQWVQATPKSREGSLQSVRIGLRQEANVTSLAQLEIVDAMGQQSVLLFEHVQLNPALGANAFRFDIPKGVDVIRP